MEVEMENRLSHFFAAIIDDPIIVLNSELLRDFRNGFKHSGHRTAVLRRNLIRGTYVLLRNYEHMYRRCRIDVIESVNRLILIYFF